MSADPLDRLASPDGADRQVSTDRVEDPTDPADRTASPDPEGAPADRPLVSIVMPTYNRAHMVERAVRCVTGQTWENLELILVNDGSTDGTDVVLERLAAEDRRIRVFNKANEGIATTLNFGFARARGDYVTWSSDDNYHRPTAVERMVDFLEERPDVDFVYTDALDVDAEGNEIGVYRAGPPERLEATCNIRGCALYRREVVEKAGGFDPTWDIAQDYDFYRRCHRAVEMGYIPEVLYEYTVHEASMSGDHVASIFEFGRVCEKYASSRAEARRTWARCYANLGRHHWRSGEGLKSCRAYLGAAVRDPRYLRHLWRAVRDVVRSAFRADAAPAGGA